VCPSAINEPFNVPRSLEPTVFNETPGVSRSRTMPFGGAAKVSIYGHTVQRHVAHTVDRRMTVCHTEKNQIKTAD